jgi:hypothetical protein
LVRSGPDFDQLSRAPGWAALDSVGQAAYRLWLLDWFPPETREVFLEDDAPADPAVAAVCRPPFEPGADRDLEATAETVAATFPPGVWPRVVREAARRAVREVRECTGFIARVAAAAESADEYARLLRARTGGKDSPESELLAAARRAVAEPLVRLDSYGVYLLSDAPPSGGKE